MKKTYHCDKHPKRMGLSGPCPDCMEAFKNRRDAQAMTLRERADEVRWWGGLLTIPFCDLQQRTEELVGRPVWTHELAHPDLLIQEIELQKPATVADVIEKIPRDKQITVVTTE